tara:strand:- start:445 stop:612 length:168 start_codon:yes stop_codon:yes gene_type:complete
MCKNKLITGVEVTRQMSKARMILNNQVIPRAELFEIRKRKGNLSPELKSALQSNA